MVFGNEVNDVSSGGLHGGRALLSPGPTFQVLWHLRMYSLKAVSLSSGMSAAPTWLLALLQLEKQRPVMNQRGHIRCVPSQVTRPSTLLAKFAAQVLPALSLHPSGGELLMSAAFFDFFIDLFSQSALSFPALDGRFLSLCSLSTL